MPADIAAKIPEAVAKVEADERQIINVCQARDFSADKLKELFKKIRPAPTRHGRFARRRRRSDALIALAAVIPPSSAPARAGPFWPPPGSSTSAWPPEGACVGVAIAVRSGPR